MREQAYDCVVLDLRLPDMSGFDVLETIRDEVALRDLPVVVFTGKELSPEEDARLRMLARSVVVKGVESPDRLLDETALFLHRVVADLPEHKRKMLERLHGSDEDLIGKQVLVVDDDVRNIFALSSVLERRGMNVLTANTGREAIATLEAAAGRGHRADGHHDAGDGRLRDDARDPPGARLRPAADHCADGEGDDGRPREMPAGRRVRLSGEARQHRTARFPRCGCGCIDRLRPMNAMEKLNILMVDDQPAKLLTYEAMLAELGENLIKAQTAREALAHLLKEDVAVVLMDVNMPELDGFELAAMIRQHPRCQKTAIIFVSAVHLTDLDRVKGYATGAVDYVSVPVVPEILRAKIGVFLDLYRKTAELERLNRTLEERVSERTAELEQTIAQLRESENRLRLQGEALAEADRRKNEFLAMLAHELRNPLQPIRTAVELLRQTKATLGAAAVGPRHHRPAGQPARAARRRSARCEPHQQRQARVAQGRRRRAADHQWRHGVDAAARRTQAPSRSK